MPNEKVEADVGRTIRPIRLVTNPEVRRIERPGASRDEHEVERRAVVVSQMKD